MREKKGIDYSTFGAPMVGRTYQSASYRYGFNGQEKDDEITGSTGTTYTAEFWEYDARLGRRWNTDPVVKQWESPYATFNNSPIQVKDPNGDTGENGQAPDDNGTDDAGATGQNTAGAPIRNDFSGSTPHQVSAGAVPPTFQRVIDATHRELFYFQPTMPDGSGYYYSVTSVLEDPSQVTIPNKPTNVPTATLVPVDGPLVTDPLVGGTPVTAGTPFNAFQGTADATTPDGTGNSVINYRQQQFGAIQAALPPGSTVTPGSFAITVSFNPAACVGVQGAQYRTAVVNALGALAPTSGGTMVGNMNVPNTINMAGPMPAFMAGAPPAFTTTVSYTVRQNLPLTWVEQ